MNKKELFESIVEYTSDLLNISDILVVLKDKEWFSNPLVAATFNQDTYTIIINESWLKIAFEDDIILVAAHETRHAYQKAVTEFSHLVKPTESSVVIKQWEKEFKNYQKPSSDEHEDYFKQAIEEDAVRYSFYIYNLLKRKIDAE